jgi:hypothetical protein
VGCLVGGVFSSHGGVHATIHIAGSVMSHGGQPLFNTHVSMGAWFDRLQGSVA